MSKTFTCAAVLFAIAEGKLHPTDPISTWIPEAASTYATLTVADLLTMRTGMTYGDDLFTYRPAPPGTHPVSL